MPVRFPTARTRGDREERGEDGRGGVLAADAVAGVAERVVHIAVVHRAAVGGAQDLLSHAGEPLAAERTVARLAAELGERGEHGVLGLLDGAEDCACVTG
jgi:hypothetical protein